MAPSLFGCAGVAHNDTLLFGTQTKLGFDISAAPEQGNVPELTLGYKRKELVWTPLFVNAQHSRFAPAEAQATRAETIEASAPGFATAAADDEAAAVAHSLAEYKYTGKGESADREGSDTYSVFASFGAKVEGSGTVAEVRGGGEIAQFFATGIAAQRLAKSPQVEELVRVKAPSQRELEAEKRVAAAEANLRQALGDEQFERVSREQNEEERGLAAKRELIVLHVSEQGNIDQDKLVQLLADASIPEDGDRELLLSAKNPTDLTTKLTNFPEKTEALYRALPR